MPVASISICAYKMITSSIRNINVVATSLNCMWKLVPPALQNNKKCYKEVDSIKTLKHYYNRV